jgi:ATP-binding cassette, subfamily B, bacterial
MARQVGRWLLVACLWTPVAGSRLLIGLLFQAVFDTLAGRAPLHFGVPALIALVACVDLARVGLQFEGIIVRLEPELEYRARDLLRTNALRAILCRPGARAISVPLGEAISRLGADVDELGRFMIWSPTNVSRVFLAALALVIMVRIDVVVTLGVAVPLAAVAALSRMTNARVTAYRRASRQTAGEVSAALGEILAAVQAIKVARAEERVVGHLSRLGQARRRSAIGEQLFTSLNLAVWSGAAAVGTGIILLWRPGPSAGTVDLSPIPRRS